MFYAKSTHGFYSEEIHGQRRIFVVDPAWARSLVEGEPDMQGVPALIEIANPECKIPVDAEVITDAEHAALLTGQSEGMCIVASESGKPTLVKKPQATAAEMQETANQSARAYLISTDWYVLRMFETGAAIPDDVSAARLAARAQVVR